MEIRPMVDADLSTLAEFAEPLQSSPDTHIVYLGVDAASIEAELHEATWSNVSAVAIEEGRTVGWLIGDIDEEVGRVWWLGPFVADEPWEASADALLRAGRAQLPSAITEEELAVDERFGRLIDWSATHGFIREAGSYVVELVDSLDGPTRPVREIMAADEDAVVALHDGLFAGTHTTGRQLVAGHDDRHRRLVIDDGGIVGYIAVEIQPDGRGYIDYLGVAPTARRRGLGGELVRAGVVELRRLGADGVGLTVREDAEGARDLYASLGFDIERKVVPLRRGFSLA